MTASVAVMAKDGFLAPHRHPQAEIYYVLEGRGTVVIDGVALIIEAGTALCIPGGSEHAIRNDANELLRLLYLFAADRIEDVNATFS
jgi:quercetin dioxygenase-like cupin family protein